VQRLDEPLGPGAVEVDPVAALALQLTVGPEVGARWRRGPRRWSAAAPGTCGLLALAAVERALDVPVRRDPELDPLALLVDHQASGDRLDPTGRTGRT
jgi:hypothetical protein